MSQFSRAKSYHLDKAKPFVNTVFRFIAGEDVLDQSISILEQAEQKYGLQIWCQFDKDFIDSDHLAKDNYRIDIAKLFDITTDATVFHSLFIKPDSTLQQRDKAIETSLYPFLSETSCIIQGLDFANDHFILFGDILIVTASQRKWGEILAAWANIVNWQGRKDWVYVDFYTHLTVIIPEYRDWVKAVLFIIRTKCERAITRLRDSTT